MIEDKDFQPIDELFRKTFDSMPDAPASSGWDVPAERVWQNVQNNIAQPAGAASAGLKAGLLLASVVVASFAVYWLAFRTPEAKIAVPAATHEAPRMDAAPAPDLVKPEALPAPAEAQPSAKPADQAKPKVATRKKASDGSPVNSRQAAQGSKDPGHQEGEPLPKQ